MIILDSISKSYNNNIILDNISLSIENGDMISIMGRSGAGKTTLLNILGLLDSPDKGRYIFDDKVIDFKNDNIMSGYRLDDIGFIVQNYALIPNKTAFDNIALTLKYKRTTKSEIKKKVTEVATKFKIDNMLQKYPYELSGGECQRVAISRAVIRNPRLILADEPTGALDERTEQDIMEALCSLNENGTSVIIVTHNPNVAKQCKRQFILSNGELLKQQ